MTDTETTPAAPTSRCCEEMQEHLHEHAFGELEADLQATVAEHLGECGSCAVVYCRLEAELRGITRAFAERPPPRVRVALRERVAREFAPSLLQRMFAALRTPVPIYGVALAAAMPLVVLWAMAAPADPAADAKAPVMTTPARIQGYDASAPLFDPSWS